MLFTLTMFPVGTGPSLRKPVAEVVDEIDRAGLHAVADIERELHRHGKDLVFR